MWCKSCNNSLPKWKPVKYEFMPERIKNERVKYFKDMVQPWRQGEASREYIEQHPDKAKKMFSESEIKKSKYVWKDLKESKSYKY